MAKHGRNKPKPEKQIILVAGGKRLTRKQWRRFEQVGLRPELDLDELVLNWSERKVKDLEARGAITGVTVEATLEGAPTVTINLRDPDRLLFRRRPGRVKKRKRRRGAGPVQVDEGWDPILPPDVLGQPMQVSLDGVTYQLVKAGYQQGSGELVLTFEHELVYLLKRHKGAKRAPRSKVTRAQFVLALVKELEPEVRRRRYRFVCPELNVRQPIDKGQRQSTPRTARTTATSSGGSSGRGLDRVFPAQHGAGGERLSVEEVRACAAAGGFWGRELTRHGADSARRIELPARRAEHGGDGGTGLWQMTPYLLLQGGRANWGPEAIAYMNKLGGVRAMRNPIQSAKMARYLYEAAGKTWQPWFGTQYVTNFSGGPGNGRPSRAQARELAATVTEGGTVEGTAGSRTVTETKSYQFARGRKESSWAAIGRLASEVKWRAFMVGNTVYYMSEEALYGRRPRYEVGPDHDAVIDLAYDVDWGKTVSEASLTVMLARWGAPPGSVVLLKGFGPPDGRWLVSAVSRDYFQPTAEVKLLQPAKALLEPANETTSRTVRGDGGGDGGGKPSGKVTAPWNIGKVSVGGVYGEDRGDHMHGGVDCSTPCGTACIACFDGTITAASTSGFSGGGMIHLRAAADVGTHVRKGDKVGWGHVSGVSCEIGEKVKAGDRVGTSGASDNGACHVHFVLIKAGAGGNGVDGNTDPAPFLRRVGAI